MEESMEDIFMSSRELMERLEKMAYDGGSFIDAVVEFAEQNEIDLEEIISMLSRSFKQKIKAEAVSCNLLKEKPKHKDISHFFQ